MTDQIKIEIENLVLSGWGYDDIMNDAHKLGWPAAEVRQFLLDFIRDNSDGAPDCGEKSKAANALYGTMRDALVGGLC